MVGDPVRRWPTSSRPSKRTDPRWAQHAGDQVEDGRLAGPVGAQRLTISPS